MSLKDFHYDFRRFGLHRQIHRQYRPKRRLRCQLQRYVNITNHRHRQHRQRHYCNRRQHLSDGWSRRECQLLPKSSVVFLVIVVGTVAENASGADRGYSEGA